MSDRRLILLTTTWPYDGGETFLSEEANHLSMAFSSVEVFPLSASNLQKRDVPGNFTIHNPAIKGNLKNRGYLLWHGIFSTAPILFALKDFFKEKAYKPGRIWNFFTALLTFRAAYPTISRFGVTSADIVYSYWGDKWALSLPFIKESTGCTTMARFHGSDLYEEAKGGYIPFRERLFQSLDKAFPISDNGAQYIAKHYSKFFNGCISVARLGVNASSPNPDKGDDTFSIISCSNAIPLKRLELIAEALQKADFPVKWTHIGSGPTLEKINVMVKSMPKNVTVSLLGQKSNEFVRDLYTKKHFDLFLNVSTTEGVPVSIMEALAAGIPVIATNVGGTGEIVDSKVGELTNVNISADELLNILRKYYFSRAGLHSMRQNAISRWDKLCNSEKNYRNFISEIFQTNQP